MNYRRQSGIIKEGFRPHATNIGRMSKFSVGELSMSILSHPLAQLALDFTAPLPAIDSASNCFSIGDRFGRYVITGYGEKRHSTLFVPVVCDCGNIRDVRFYCLRKGLSLSCGCRANDINSVLHTTHGGSYTRIYWVWRAIRDRCESPKNSHYLYYGGRGIKLCAEWRNSFESFRDWSDANGYAAGLQIDRIDLNGDYHPQNCRFVTRTVNARNKSNSRFVTAFGETKTLSAWSEDPRCRVSQHTLKLRLNKGREPEEIITTPSLAEKAKRDAIIPLFGPGSRGKRTPKPEKVVTK